MGGGVVGWSGYTVGLNVSVSVDAHGGEREERGERLSQELTERLKAARAEILADPKWEENSDAISVYDW